MSWPQDSLKRHLALNYPGCKTAFEAVRSVLKKTPSKDETASQTMEQTIVAKLKEVTEVIAERSEGLPIDLIPEIRRQQLADMPLDSVEEIRAWGISWISVLKDLKLRLKVES